MAIVDVDVFINSVIHGNDVVLFVKGTREAPMCGFSAKVISILEDIGIVFEVVDVMQDSNLRDAIKVYSDWPTLPQVYIKGEFIGGCDIVAEMHSNGELVPYLRGAGVVAGA